MDLNCFLTYLHDLNQQQESLPNLIHKETHLFFSLFSLINLDKNKKYIVSNHTKLQALIKHLTVSDEITLLNDIQQLTSHFPKAKLLCMKNAVLPFMKSIHVGKKFSPMHNKVWSKKNSLPFYKLDHH